MDRPVRVTVVAVAAHLLAHAAHGVVHELIPVRIANWQTGFVVVVILLAPILGAVALVRGRRRLGGLALALAGVAALGFEVAYHFVVENPDHVGVVADGAAAFASTAVVAAASDALLIAVGAWLVLAGGRR